MPMEYYRYGSYSSTALKMSTHRLSALLLASKKLTNPHTHEGCELPVRDYGYLLQVSIHTPTRGVTVLPLR